MKIEVGKMRKLQINLFFMAKLLPFLLVFLWVEIGLAIPVEEIRKMQVELQGKSTGERIVFFAERFVGAPYDKDPQGEYVTRAAIVADERGERGTPFAFAVLAIHELKALFRGQSFAALYRLTYPG